MWEGGRDGLEALSCKHRGKTILVMVVGLSRIWVYWTIIAANVTYIRLLITHVWWLANTNTNIWSCGHRVVAFAIDIRCFCPHKCTSLILFWTSGLSKYTLSLVYSSVRLALCTMSRELHSMSIFCALNYFSLLMDLLILRSLSEVLWGYYEVLKKFVIVASTLWHPFLFIL